MSLAGPGIIHEERKELLDTIAILAGYDIGSTTCLPDGTRPDVLRFDSQYGSVFLGDAKDAEFSSCSDTLHRLARYMSWFKAISDSHRGSIFAICFGEALQTSGWMRAVSHLAEEAGVNNFTVEYEEVDDISIIVWLKLQL